MRPYQDRTHDLPLRAGFNCPLFGERRTTTAASANPATVVQWMPPGLQFFSPASHAGRQMVEANESTALSLMEKLEALKADGKKPGLDFDHSSFASAYHDCPIAAEAEEFFWAGDRLDQGIHLRVKWTEAGWRAVYAGEYRTVSPCFAHDGFRGIREIFEDLGGLVKASAFRNGPLPTAALRLAAERDSALILRCVNDAVCNLKVPALDAVNRERDFRPEQFENFRRLIRLKAENRELDPHLLPLVEVVG